MILAHTIRHHLASLIGGGHKLSAGGLGPGESSRWQQGFSLLEALVAMSIASIALASLYGTWGKARKVLWMSESGSRRPWWPAQLAGSTFAEDIERQPSGASGVGTGASTCSKQLESLCGRRMAALHRGRRCAQPWRLSK